MKDVSEFSEIWYSRRDVMIDDIQYAFINQQLLPTGSASVDAYQSGRRASLGGNPCQRRDQPSANEATTTSHDYSAGQKQLNLIP